MTIDTHGLWWAQKFHETYERLAPSFGYETRPDTRQFESESKNGQLMIAVCGELIREAEQAQLQRDAEAICYYCSAHDEFEPALWMDEELEPGDYRHKNKTGRGTAWCQASLIWADWAERQAATTQEDFADAIRADPDMTPEQKAKWLDA